jgi:hypothetical protein
MDPAKLFLYYLEELKNAICSKDVDAILLCYDNFYEINFDFVPPELLNKYEALVDRANDILYSKLVETNEGRKKKDDKV